MIKSPRINPLVSSGLPKALTLNNLEPTGISLNYGNTGYGVSKLERFLPISECVQRELWCLLDWNYGKPKPSNIGNIFDFQSLNIIVKNVVLKKEILGRFFIIGKAHIS